MPSAVELQTINPRRNAAEDDNLAYVSPDDPGIVRSKSGRGFTYRDPWGGLIRDPQTLNRIRKLVIPPAWVSVWICPDASGHIQAIGLDQKGRRQYRYHPRFREVRDRAKFDHLITFAAALPRLRLQVSADMGEPGLGKRKILATVVHLLESTMIRVGNLAYVKQNKSYGLTTLQSRHVKVEGADLRFHFRGKSGKIWSLSIRDRRVAKVVRSCQELPGQRLFQYLDDSGERCSVTSDEINAYLKDISGQAITAKEFRTWAGTVLAAMVLVDFERADSQATTKKNMTQAINRVSARLCNTPTICRKCYVHPEVLAAYMDGDLTLDVNDSNFSTDFNVLRPEEEAVLAFLRARLR